MPEPEQLLYAKTHEWVYVETAPDGAKIATLGISAFALKALTDLVYIDLPQAGRELAVGESFGEIESVKAVSDIYSPVEGRIVEVNAAIADHLEQLGNDPYGAGWLVKIRVADESGLKALMDHAAYQRQCEEEGKE
jgi:glycine cleavage system H protein